MNKPEIRNLPIPYFSQRENNFVWKERIPLEIFENEVSVDNPDPNKGCIKQGGEEINLLESSCNITCIAMILHYYGVTQKAPYQLLEELFDPFNEMAQQLKSSFSQSLQDHHLKGGILQPGYIEDNSFAPDYIETFFQNSGLKCKKNFTFSRDNAMEKAIASGNPFILRVGTLEETIKLLTDEKPTKEERLESFFTQYTSSHNIRVDFGNGLDYKRLLDLKDEYDNQAKTVINPNANEEQQEQARQSIDNIIDEIHGAKITSGAGHFVVVRGYTEDEIIINDPWGKVAQTANGRVITTTSGLWNLYDESESSFFGDNIKIKIDDFKKRAVDDGNNWAWFFSKANRWDFVYPRILPQSQRPEESDYESCRDYETLSFGGYPVRSTLTLHTGIHIRGENSPIRSIGPGQLIAARIKPEQTDEGFYYNGSPCFVLIKHQIIVDEKIKDFYSLYYHLFPITNVLKELEEYPVKRTASTDWLKPILSRCFSRAIVGLNKNSPVYRCSDNVQIGILEKNSAIIVENRSSRTIDDKNVECLEYYYNGTSVYSPKNEFRAVYFSTEDEIELFKQKIHQLDHGEIVYFDDLPTGDDVIEISSGSNIGSPGWFLGYTSLENIGLYPPVSSVFHWEVFSDEPIMTNPTKEGFIHLDLSKDDDSLYLNGLYTTQKLKETDAFALGDFENLEDEGKISSEEYANFYRGESSKGMCDYIISAYSEFSSQIDWINAYGNAKGLNRNAQIVRYPSENRREVFPIKDYVDGFRLPHSWFDHTMGHLMGPLSDKLLSQGKATFYHPIRILEWLIDRGWNEWELKS